jgi:hypothetical protein
MGENPPIKCSMIPGRLANDLWQDVFFYRFSRYWPGALPMSCQWGNTIQTTNGFRQPQGLVAMDP